MARVYVSSTFNDLKEHRAQVVSFTFDKPSRLNCSKSGKG